jgi:PAS domain-containing protein
MAMALKEGRPVRGVEGIAERPDGTRVRFIPYPTPLYDSAGAMVGAVNMAVDISDRKRAEETVARHRDEQAALYGFTDRLFRASSLQDVYDAALDAIRRALGCERASVLLFDEAGVMRFVAWAGLSEEEAVDGHVARRQGPQPIAFLISRPPTRRPSRPPSRQKALPPAFVPLVVEGRLIGKFTTGSALLPKPKLIWR